MNTSRFSRLGASLRRRQAFCLGLAVLLANQVQAAQAANLTVWGTQIVYPVSGHEATFTQVAAGQIHNLALKQDGTVLAWGWNGFGQSSVPAGLSGVVAMAGAYGHSLALK